MTNYKITEEDIKKNGVQSLRDHPNRGGTFGTNGLSAEDLKKRYDALPSLIAERFNAFLDALAEGNVEMAHPDFPKAETLAGVLAEIGGLAILFEQYMQEFRGKYSETKGYYWSHIDLAGKKIYLSNTQVRPVLGTGTLDASFESPKYVAGDRICIVNGSKFDHGAGDVTATVASVDHNVITYSGKIGFSSISAVAEPFDVDDFTLFVIEHPDVGPAVVRIGGFSAGRGSAALGLFSTALGMNTLALGNWSVAEGRETVAHYIARASGLKTKAIGAQSVADGFKTKAVGTRSSAHGDETVAEGEVSTSEGSGSRAKGKGSHASGYWTTAEGEYSRSDGFETYAGGDYSAVLGYLAKALGFAAFAGGGTYKYGDLIVPTIASGKAAFAWGRGAKAEEQASVAMGSGVEAALHDQAVFGRFNVRDEEGKYAFIVGWGFGVDERENVFTVTIEGEAAAGGKVLASKEYVDAKILEELKARILGLNTTATGKCAFAGGNGSEASGLESFTFGRLARALASQATAFGLGTIATKDRQSVFGQYNIEDVAKRYMHIIGCGWSDTNRINIHTVDELGVAWYKGGVRVGGTSQDDGEELMTRKEVQKMIQEALGGK